MNVKGEAVLIRGEVTLLYLMTEHADKGSESVLKYHKIHT